MMIANCEPEPRTCVRHRSGLFFRGFRGIVIPRNLVFEVENTIFPGFISPGSQVRVLSLLV
jgi:hypothetical protein